MDGFWSQAISAGLGSGFAIALIKVGFDAYKLRNDKQQRERNRPHLALHLAVYLEGYAAQCASEVDDHELAKSCDGHAGNYLMRVPDPGPLPEVAFDLLDIEIVDALLDFPQRCQMAQASADSCWDIIREVDEFQKLVGVATIKMGMSAMEIARRLRNTYGLKPRDMTFGTWDVDEFFADRAARLAKIEKERRGEEEAETADLFGSELINPR
jgi:hypothetical protein